MTGLGPSNGCTNACKDYKGADRCGGQYAISLYRLTGVQYDTGAGADLRPDRWHFGREADEGVKLTRDACSHKLASSCFRT